MRRLSASQLTLWKTCQRRWAFNYLGGEREAPALSARAGTAVHELVEQALTNSQPVDRTIEFARKFPSGEAAHRLAERARELTLGETNPLIEQEIEAEIDGVPFKMVIDYLTDYTVLDHKTTSKLRYMKTQDVLLRDPQRLLYTHVLADRRRAVWNSFVWSEGIVYTVDMPISLPDDKEHFKLHVLQPTHEIQAVADGADILSLPATKSSCDLYPPYGCPFKSRCFPSSEKKSMSSLLERLKAKHANTEQQETSDPVMETPSAEQTAVVETTKTEDTSETTAQPIDWLFVDCVPTEIDERPVNLDKMIAEANAFVARAQKLPNAMLMQYAAGGPAVAAVVLGHLQQTERIKYAYMTTYTAEGKATYAVIASLAKRIVRGL